MTAYIYDGDGNRVAETASGVTTKYLVDDLNPTGYPQVVEEIVNGAPQREYTYGLQRIDEDQIVNGAWTPRFYGYDGFGTVRQLTNASGAVTDTYEYDAFGNLLNKTGTSPNNYLYRGERYDSDLGLYYLRARYYNPLTGRFMSRDPEDGDITNPATLHKYLYADADPVDLMDPTGRDAEEYALVLNDVSVSRPVVAAVTATGLAVACKLLWDATKFSAEVEAAQTNGYVTQVAPCYWSAVKGKTTNPPPAPLPFPIPGTPASPWPPRCKDLRDAVNAAKDLIGSFHPAACQAGMSTWQLQVRYDAWVGLCEARAQEDKVCWNGGNQTHQEEEEKCWNQVANCSQMLPGAQ